MTENDYLEAESSGDVKHEYMGGHVVAMAGASKNHERIARNMIIALTLGLKQRGSSCKVFGSDIKVKTADNYFYPDGMVVCDDSTDSDYFSEAPVMLIEVLSKSTRRMDQSTKRLAYQNIPTLAEYVLIEQDLAEVEVCTRHRGWRSYKYFPGETITFESIGVTLLVEALYEGVDSHEVVLNLRNKT